MVLPTPESFLIHEMAHAVQDATWDQSALIRIVESQLKPLFASLPVDQLRTPAVRAMYQNRRFKYLEGSIDPDYRASILAQGDGAGFTEPEWLVFFDFLLLLGEVDAFAQAAALSQELGDPLPFGRSQQEIFDYVWEVYANRNQAISALGQHFLPRESALVFELVKSLRAYPRSR